MSFYPYWHDIDASSVMFCDAEDVVAYSNRPFVDNRTQDEKEEYEKYILKQEADKKDRCDYDWICQNIPEIAPKSYGAYRNMKHKNSANYRKLVSIAKEHGYTI